MGNNKKKVLIIGAKGRVGNLLSEYLARSGFEVTATFKNAKKPNNGGINWISGDVLNIDDNFKEELKKAEIIIYLAAKLGMYDRQVWTVNVEGIKNTLRFLKNKNKTRLIFFSSIDAFGLTNKKEVNENNKVDPITDYGKSKLRAEREIVLFSKRNKNLKFVILRVGNIVGIEGNLIDDLNKRLTKNRLERWFLKNILGDCELSVVDINLILRVVEAIILRENFNNKIRFLSEKTVKINCFFKQSVIKECLREIMSWVMIKIKRGGFYLYLAMKNGDKRYRRFSKKILNELNIKIING